MSNELVPVEATVVDRVADERELLRRRAEELATLWLHGYTNPKTRNRYARDIGLSAEAQAEIPGAPAHPKPPAEWAWIPWALNHGLNPAGHLRRRDAESYAHALAGMPKNTRQARWTALCAFYRSLRADELVACNPGELVNRRTMGLAGLAPSSTLPLHAAHVRALYLAASLPARGQPRAQAMLAVLAATGCRAAELVAINLDDCRPQPDGHSLIRLHGKGGKERWTTLPAPDAELVDAYLQVRVGGRPSTVPALPGQVNASSAAPKPLFTTARGTRLHVNAVTQMLRTLAARPTCSHPAPKVRAAARTLASVADTIHPHQFRHTYTVVAEQAGVPLSRIQADLGHASLQTTQTYLHAQQGAEHSAARVVSGIYHDTGRKKKGT